VGELPFGGVGESGCEFSTPPGNVYDMS
jgi:hypothetical protein